VVAPAPALIVLDQEQVTTLHHYQKLGQEVDAALGDLDAAQRAQVLAWLTKAAGAPESGK
jgi:hypothetical protein